MRRTCEKQKINKDMELKIIGFVVRTEKKIRFPHLILISSSFFLFSSIPPQVLVSLILGFSLKDFPSFLTLCFLWFLIHE